MTRKERDHERYMRQREERLKRQREYYKANREQCRESVRKCQMRATVERLRNYERKTEQNTPAWRAGTRAGLPKRG